MRENLGIARGCTFLLLFAALAVLPALPSTADADDGDLQLHLDNVALNSDYLTFDLLLKGAFTDKQEEALLKGLPTHMTYTVELWRERDFWFDKLELTRSLTMKVTYDLWAERFVVHHRRDRVARFDTMQEAEEATCRLQGLRLVQAGELHPSERYYISVRAHLRPLTVEELGELEDWLRGDVGSGGERGGILSMPKYFARMLLGTTGVTDRSILARSHTFTFEDVPRKGSIPP